MKQAKNRESARNSRKRKKIYIELLEKKVNLIIHHYHIFKKVNQLTQELNATKKQLNLNTCNLNQMTTQTKLVFFLIKINIFIIIIIDEWNGKRKTTII